MSGASVSRMTQRLRQRKVTGPLQNTGCCTRAHARTHTRPHTRARTHPHTRPGCVCASCERLIHVFAIARVHTPNLEPQNLTLKPKPAPCPLTVARHTSTSWRSPKCAAFLVQHAAQHVCMRICMASLPRHLLPCAQPRGQMPSWRLSQCVSGETDGRGVLGGHGSGNSSERRSVAGGRRVRLHCANARGADRRQRPGGQGRRCR